jgi:ABC-type amino acid transport substrate-binding protein
MVRRSSSKISSWVSTVAALAVIVAVVAFLVPETTTTSRMCSYNTGDGDLWYAISNLRDYPSWRSSVTEVTELPARNGKDVWRVKSADDTRDYTVTATDKYVSMTLQFTNEEQAFTGTWTFRVSGDDNRGQVTIVESGRIDGLLPRIMNLSRDRTIELDTYLVDLGARFGEKVHTRSGPE